MLVLKNTVIPIRTCPFCRQEVLIDKFSIDERTACVRCSCGAVISFIGAENKFSFIKRWNYRPETDSVFYYNVNGLYS